MRIDLTRMIGESTICFVTLREVRDFLRHYETVSLKETESFFRLGSGAAEEAPILLATLVKEGFLEKDADQNGDEEAPRYRATELGRRLRIAKAYKRISRAKAREILDRFRETIEAINADDSLVYNVEEVYLFGSILDGNDDLGDIDVGFRVSPRDGLEGRALVEANLARAGQSGRRHRNYVEELYFGVIEVRRLLRCSRMIELHEIDDLKEIGAAAALFYSRQGGFVADWEKQLLTRFGAETASHAG